MDAVEVFKAYRVKVIADELNIRKGFGITHSVNGSINDKGVYTIVLKDESGK